MKRVDSVLLILLMALWGFNFSVIKLGVDQINPLVLTALRFTCAVFPLIFFIPKPDVPWRYLIAYGFSFGIGVWGLTTLSVYAGNSVGMTSLLLDMSVVSGLLIGWLVLKEKITKVKLAGSLLALIGLLLIIWFDDGVITPVVLVLAASAFWSINGLIVKLANTKQIFAFNLWGMLFAPLPLLLLAVLVYGSDAVINLPQQLNRQALFSILFQAYPTTLLGYWFWNKMIMKYSISSVAPMTLLVPVFAIAGGYWFYQEVIGWPHVVAIVFILAGVLLGELKFNGKKSPIIRLPIQPVNSKP